MQDTGTFSKGLLALEAPREPLLPVPIVARAEIAVQIVSERQAARHPGGPARVEPAEAVDAYRSGARMAIRRMPAGYRKTIVA